MFTFCGSSYDCLFREVQRNRAEYVLLRCFSIFNHTRFPKWEAFGGLKLPGGNRPFPTSPQSLFQSESKSEIFVMAITSNFIMNGN